MPASSNAACNRRALAQAYSLPRTPRRWRTSSTRSIFALARVARNESRSKP